MKHYDPNSEEVKAWKLQLKDRIKKKRLAEIAERLAYLGPKVDSGQFRYREKQEKDRLIEEYIKLEQEINGGSK